MRHLGLEGGYLYTSEVIYLEDRAYYKLHMIIPNVVMAFFKSPDISLSTDFSISYFEI